MKQSQPSQRPTSADMPGWLVDALAQPLSYKNPALLFHGSSERIEGPLRPSGYDGLLWFASTPAIAQSYIPRSGGSVGYQKPIAPDELIRPPQRPFADCINFTIAVQMGHRLRSVEYDASGNLRSWSWEGEAPRRKDVHNHIVHDLGYAAADDGWLWLSSRMRQTALDAAGCRITQEVLPQGFRAAGKLFVIPPDPTWKLLDFTGEGEDLTQPQYHEIQRFQEADRRGYDGVVIHDFAQVDHHGNLGHTSWGLFKRAASRIEPFAIDCVRFTHDEAAGSIKYVPFPESTQEFEALRMAAAVPPRAAPNPTVRMRP